MHANPATSVLCLPFLTPEECEHAVRVVPEESWQSGEILAPSEAEVDPGAVRRCAISHRVDEEILRRTEAHVRGLNDRHFRFELSGPSEHDPTTLVRYQPGDHFVWHIDNGAAGVPLGTRKLSFVVQLSDPATYGGGDLELAMYQQGYGGDAFIAQGEQLRTQGALTVFAAFHLHRVSPITRGTRHALVGWLHGPPFR